MIEVNQRMADDRAAYAVTFGTAAGRKVLRDIYRLAYTIRIDRENPNPNSAVFMAGQMSLVQAIMAKAGLTHADMMEDKP